MITYRKFIIHPSYMHGFDYVHEDYDGAPDANDSRAGTCLTVEECKEEIDNWYKDNVDFRVQRFIPGVVNTITKFKFLTDAIDFCQKVGEDLSAIKIYFDGEEIEFDSI